MFPDATIDHAASRVRDCLNHDRRERFTPEQVLMLLRGLAIRSAAMPRWPSWLCDMSFSDPQPVEPEDEVARLRREYVEATKALLHMANKIDAMQTAS